MSESAAVLRRLREIVGISGDRVGKARRLTAAIREMGGYQWVGIYDVATDEIGAVAWSGSGAPAHPRFPSNRGLCGASVSARATVLVGDVTKDPRYLTTLPRTRSEIVVPVLETGGRVVGLLVVGSCVIDAFRAEDRRELEEYAKALAPFWG